MVKGEGICLACPAITSHLLKFQEFVESLESSTFMIGHFLFHLRIARECLEKVSKQKGKLKKNSKPGDSRKEDQAALAILVSFMGLLLCFALFCD